MITNYRSVYSPSVGPVSIQTWTKDSGNVPKRSVNEHENVPPSNGTAWRQSQIHGGIIATEMSKSLTDSNEPGANLFYHISTQKTTGGQVVTYDYSNIAVNDIPALSASRWGFGSSPVSSYSEAAFTAALADARAGGYDVLTELAEAPETLAMLKGFIPEGAEMLRKYKKHWERIDPRKLKAYHKLPKKLRTYTRLAGDVGSSAANAWLLFRYGLTPLVLSMQEILEKYSEKLGLYKTYRGRDQSNLAETMVWPMRFSAKTGLTFSIEGSRSFEAVSRGWVKCMYTTNTLLRNAKRLLRIDPIGTAYELLPLSFVVDWFVNVGDFIAANSISFADSEVATKSFQVKLEDTYRIRADSTLTEGTSTYTLLGDSTLLTSNFSSYWRKLSDPSARLSLWDKRLSTFRTLDGIALEWQILRSNLRKLR